MSNPYFTAVTDGVGQKQNVDLGPQNFFFNSLLAIRIT
jgi:hypothetical protein